MSGKKPKPRMPVIGIKDTKGLGPKLKKIAEAEDLTLSQVIRRALIREIEVSGK